VLRDGLLPLRLRASCGGNDERPDVVLEGESEARNCEGESGEKLGFLEEWGERGRRESQIEIVLANLGQTKCV